MTFYEQELQKIVGERYPDATYVGRTCYVQLGDMNRAKIEFVKGIQADRYIALQLTILNRCEGKVDVLWLQFEDLFGKQTASNSNCSKRIWPYIWDDRGNVDWNGYHPTRQDYEALSNAVSDYLEVFQDILWLGGIVRRHQPLGIRFEGKPCRAAAWKIQSRSGIGRLHRC